MIYSDESDSGPFHVLGKHAPARARGFESHLIRLRSPKRPSADTVRTDREGDCLNISVSITFITGNQSKADYLARYLGFPVDHIKLDLDEIQSLDLKKIAEHKVRQAYEKIKKPVIVEDVALEFEALGGLPGPFIRFFEENISFENICALLDGKSRKATARSVFGYFDGSDLKLFESHLDGTIAEKPAGENGFGWDKIFIPDGYSKTRAQLGEEDNQKTYTQIKPFAKLKEFLLSR